MAHIVPSNAPPSVSPKVEHTATHRKLEQIIAESCKIAVRRSGNTDTLIKTSSETSLRHLGVKSLPGQSNSPEAPQVRSTRSGYSFNPAKLAGTKSRNKLMIIATVSKAQEYSLVAALAPGSGFVHRNSFQAQCNLPWQLNSNVFMRSAPISSVGRGTTSEQR